MGLSIKDVHKKMRKTDPLLLVRFMSSMRQPPCSCGLNRELTKGRNNIDNFIAGLSRHQKHALRPRP